MSFLNNPRFITGSKPVLHLLLALPFLALVYGWWAAFMGGETWLGFNPQEASNRFTGEWALKVLFLSLAVTPLGVLTGSKLLVGWRRMFGLWAFFYVLAHITSYVWLDMLFDWATLWADLTKRVYIMVGMAASLLMLPLAITSTQAMIRRMGAKRWRRLHKAVYVSGILGVVHFIMMRKGWQIEPLVYALVLGVLFGLRYKGLDRALKARRKAKKAVQQAG